MTCSNPIDAAILTDYRLGSRYRRAWHRGAPIRLRCLRSSPRAAEQGLRIREYAPPPGGTIDGTATAEDDLFIGHLRANFAEARRVDLYICDAHSVEQHRSVDIPLHSQTEGVAFQQPITYIANRSHSTTPV